jgi:uncharacterized protein YdcH (DUF465 family)
MITIPGKDPFYQKLLSEHCELDHRVQAIEELFNAGHDAEEPRTRLLKMLKELLEQIERHFAEEEKGGVLEEAVCRLPRLCSQLAGVERRHQPLLEQLRALVGQAERCGTRPRDWDRLADAFSRFAYALRAHEAAENRIADEAFGKGGFCY